MPQSLTATVADGLVALVLDGLFPPGSTLPSEADLAVRFNVSRLTVREAIRTLAASNLIGVRQGRSSVVNTPDKWSPLDPRLLLARSQASEEPLLLFRKLIEARRTVEIGIAELAAVRRTEEHLQELLQHLEAMREAHQHSDVDRFVDADIAFHNTLFKAADNVFLDAVFEPLAAVLRTLRAATSSVSEIRVHGIDWHDHILIAIRHADPGASRETMRAHLAQTEEDSDRYLIERTRRQTRR
jgi:DNA-binding FadR family transcriptional regulator